MNTLNPEMTPDQRSDLLIQLKLIPETIAQLNNGQVSGIRGNIKYTVGKVNTSTFMFIASAKDL